VTQGPPLTTSIGNGVLSPDGKSVLALNSASIYKSTDQGWHWAAVGPVPLTPSGAMNDAKLFATKGSLSLIGTETQTLPAGQTAHHGGKKMVRADSTDSGKTFAAIKYVGQIDVPAGLGAYDEFYINGLDTIVPLTSHPGTVLTCGGGYTPDARPSVLTCPTDLSGKPPPKGCGASYLGVTKNASLPIINMNVSAITLHLMNVLPACHGVSFCMSSTKLTTWPLRAVLHAQHRQRR
jgi:hypothetical protein